jgi:PLAC8 family
MQTLGSREAVTDDGAFHAQRWVVLHTKPPRPNRYTERVPSINIPRIHPASFRSQSSRRLLIHRAVTLYRCTSLPLLSLDMSRPYNNSFWSCCSPFDLCVKACCCPCVVYGKNHYRNQHGTGQGYDMFNGHCAAWCGLFCLGHWGWILQCVNRSDMQEKHSRSSMHHQAFSAQQD